ncbi:MAG: adenylate/guanylate cyclase domain-containing protein [Leptospiraceae bacterium]|nr:adenylate/guanylate cyclase domain-containing protein [Leptospiraceae bacterium]
MITNLITRYRNLGVTERMLEFEKRSYYIFNFLLAIVMFITVVYSVVPYFVLHIAHVKTNHLLNTGLLFGYLLCAVLAGYRRPIAARLLFTTLVQFHIFIFTYILGWQIGNYMFYLALPALPYVIFYNSRFGVAYGLITGAIGFAASYYIKLTNHRLVDVSASIYDGLFLLAFGSTFAVVFLVVRLFFKLSRSSDIRLNLEKQKSERLLLNVLPEDIAARLQRGETTIADHYDPVVVLFADIVGFTEISSRTPPAEIVRRLNEVFSLIDILVEKYGLEKIKTIGDAYMVVAGIPQPQDDDLERIVNFAHEIHEMIHAVSGLQLRIGIDRGEATAGVIGTKKFIFDLWGDTVNTASRMESHGEAGKIHVTERVAEMLKGKFIITERGTMLVKGKGEMKTFYVLGPQAS